MNISNIVCEIFDIDPTKPPEFYFPEFLTEHYPIPKFIEEMKITYDDDYFFGYDDHDNIILMKKTAISTVDKTTWLHHSDIDFAKAKLEINNVAILSIFNRFTHEKLEKTNVTSLSDDKYDFFLDSVDIAIEIGKVYREKFFCFKSYRQAFFHNNKNYTGLHEEYDDCRGTLIFIGRQIDGHNHGKLLHYSYDHKLTSISYYNKNSHTKISFADDHIVELIVKNNIDHTITLRFKIDNNNDKDDSNNVVLNKISINRSTYVRDIVNYKIINVDIHNDSKTIILNCGTEKSFEGIHRCDNTVQSKLNIIINTKQFKIYEPSYRWFTGDYQYFGFNDGHTIFYEIDFIY